MSLEGTCRCGSTNIAIRWKGLFICHDCVEGGIFPKDDNMPDHEPEEDPSPTDERDEREWPDHLCCRIGGI